MCTRTRSWRLLDPLHACRYRQLTKNSGPRTGTGAHPSRLVVPADLDELVGVEARPAHQRAVDVLAGHDVPDVVRLHRAAVEDPYPVGGRAREHLGDPRPDGADHLLG